MRQTNKLFLLLALLLTAATGAWADTSIVGPEDNLNDGYYSGDHKKNYSLEPGKTITIEFTVSTATDDQLEGDVWNPWYAWAVNFWDGTLNAITIEPRNYGWEANTDNTRWTENWVKSWEINYPDDWESGYNFRDNMLQGATVVTTIKRDGADVIIIYDITTTSKAKYRQYVVKTYGDGTKTIWFDLIVDHCHITIDNDKTVTTDTENVVPTYTVKMKDGTVDAKNWSIASGEKSAKGDAADGLTGLSEGDAVTLTYTGRLKVKGVKATSDAAAASVPDGALSGVFSVSSTKKVYFSKGNLRYASSKWSFFDNQYDYYESYSADAWDKFGWSTSAPTYGMNTTTSVSDYQGDFVDWGATMGAGWFTLSNDEWTYLINIRTVNGGTGNGKSYTRGQSVNGKLGVVIYPDNYTGAVYSGSDWATFESAGCVFLPAAGRRNGSSMEYAGTRGYYWSATPNGENYAYGVLFTSDILNPASANSRRLGSCVRLVREVATSDAEQAKPAATVTTAPTGAAIVGAGKTTALVSGGVAEGGTLRYAVTTENTKPASTDGFSDAVPTAQSITASGKVYVWYYVKGNDTHSDSEIAAAAIEVPVADIVWDATNVNGLGLWGTDEYEMDGVKLSGIGENQYAAWSDGINFELYSSGGFTFTAPTGKAFTKIEMNAVGPEGWDSANLGDGWAFNVDWVTNTFIGTWKGSAAASTVGLLTDVSEFGGAQTISYIAFYLSE